MNRIRRNRPTWLDAQGRVIDEEDRGLGYDLQTLVDRRSALGLFGGISAAALLAACGSPSSSSTLSSAPAGAATPGTATTGSAASSSAASGTAGAAAATTATTTAAAGTAVSEVPDETAGPYPGDGSNGPDVLDKSGIVRRDIRSSFGSSTTTAAGVPLTVALTVRHAGTGDALAGAAVYAWHCDRDGNYSLYSQAAANENYLRGVQEVDANGTATFTTIFPGCYSGRWPHIHFEVYATKADATGAGPIVKTSQIALPKEACQAAYATTGYESSVGNLGQVSLARDMVFGDDGGIHQLASMSGDATTGYTAALTIGV